LKAGSFQIFQKTLKQENKMKQLHNISNISSRQRGAEPMGQGYACIILLDSEFVEKRCLYTWVS
jgi:hypothetical protein